jgi:hypothetical protein
MAQTIICLSCYHRFSAARILFRCIMPDCTGQVPDEIYVKAHPTDEAPQGRILFPNQSGLNLKVPRAVPCDVCRYVSHARICPQCHADLPYDTGRINQYNITIIGSHAIDRLQYIAALVNHLQYETGKHFGFTVRMPDDSTQQRWKQDFYQPLLIQKEVTPPSDQLDQRSNIPLTLRLTFTHGHRRRALNISLFETSVAIPETTIQPDRRICFASGIILLLDPLQIPAIRQQLTATSLPPLDPEAAPQNIVEHLRYQFEQVQHLPNTQKVKIPIAFTLSKVDNLTSLLTPDSALHHPSEHAGHVDRKGLQSVHTEIENYLATWIGPHFNRFIHNNFARYNYSGVSAPGKLINSHMKVSIASPLRIEDPFLWILSQLKLI